MTTDALKGPHEVGRSDRSSNELLRSGSNRPEDELAVAAVTRNDQAEVGKASRELLDQFEGGPEVVSNGRTAIKAVELIAALYDSSEQRNARIDLPLADRSRVIGSS